MEIKINVKEPSGSSSEILFEDSYYSNYGEDDLGDDEILINIKDYNYFIKKYDLQRVIRCFCD